MNDNKFLLQAILQISPFNYLNSSDKFKLDLVAAFRVVFFSFFFLPNVLFFLIIHLSSLIFLFKLQKRGFKLFNIKYELKI